MKWIIVILLLTVGAFLVWQRQAVAAPPPGFVVVTEVFDGDTIEVRLANGREKVRLMGVDTPETKDPRRPVQCFGKEAATQTKRSLKHQAVRLETDTIAGDRDKYHRLLRYVYLANGTLYNETLVRGGYAHEYTYQNQRYDHQDELKAAEAEAKESGRGFWNPATCNGDTKQPA